MIFDHTQSPDSGLPICGPYTNRKSFIHPWVCRLNDKSIVTKPVSFSFEIFYLHAKLRTSCPNKVRLQNGDLCVTSWDPGNTFHKPSYKCTFTSQTNWPLIATLHILENVYYLGGGGVILYKNFMINRVVENFEMNID